MTANKWWVFATVACGSFMATIDLSAVNLALPALREIYQLDLAMVEWVVLTYLVGITSLLLTMGRLADIVGRGRLYNLGFVVFTIGSILCGAAPNIPALIGFRAVQAVGSAMLISSASAILLDAFPANQRGQAMGLMATIFSLGAMIGPTLGGALLTWVGWRAIFFVNVPVGILGMALAFHFLPRNPGARQGKFDVWGSVLVGLAIVALLVSITRGQQVGWRVEVVVLAAIAVVLSAAFIIRQHRIPEPLVRLGLFRTHGFGRALVGQMATTMAVSTHVLLMPFFLVTIEGRTEAQAGLVLLAYSVTLAVLSPVGGWLSDHFDDRWVASTGSLIMMIGYLLMSGLNASWSAFEIASRIIIVGAGNSLFTSPNSNAAYRFVRSDERGLAVGTLAFARNLSLTIGIAVAGIVWTIRRISAAQALHVDPGSSLAQVQGMHDSYLLVSGYLLVALLASLGRSPRGRPEGAVERPVAAEEGPVEVLQG